MLISKRKSEKRFGQRITKKAMNKLISLTQGFFAIVDEQDYESLSQFKWTVKINPTNTYAYRKDGGKTIHMHRVVLEAKHEEICDHINGNGIDNRRKNLR